MPPRSLPTLSLSTCAAAEWTPRTERPVLGSHDGLITLIRRISACLPYCTSRQKG